MEESGHYYTVYYTSLAVGFNGKKAFRHAALSQMADEIGYLDAANLYDKEILGPFKNRIEAAIKGILSYPVKFENIYDIEHDLNDNPTKVLPEWRDKTGYAIHALPPKPAISLVLSSKFQQQITQELLDRYKEDSVEFGLLLHRLGDTYAHTTIGNEGTMYNSFSPFLIRYGTYLNLCNMGHLRDLHLPDYWFLRKDTFFIYLRKLYDILLAKRKEALPAANTRLSYEALERNYMFILLKHGHLLGVPDYPFEKPHISSGIINLVNHQSWKIDDRSDKMKHVIIEEIRKEMRSFSDVIIESYAPEKIQLQKFSEFLISTGVKLTNTEFSHALETILKDIYEAETMWYQRKYLP